MAKSPANTFGFATHVSKDTGASPAVGAPNPRIDNRPPEPVPPGHRRAVQRGVDEAARGEFATDAEVKAAFRRFGP
jgi:hypothetical protein